MTLDNVNIPTEILDSAIRQSGATHLRRRSILGLLRGALKGSKAGKNGLYPIRLLGVAMMARVDDSGTVQDLIGGAK